MLSRLTQGVTSVLQELSGEEHRGDDPDPQVSLHLYRNLFIIAHTHTHNMFFLNTYLFRQMFLQQELFFNQH